jgi:ParB-like chromosome segregation protein Spo0J
MNAPTIEMLGVAAINVGPRHRHPTDASVGALADSLARHGLQNPILIRYVENVEIDGEEWENAAFLVAGATRLAAAKKLGWKEIACIDIGGDDVHAELVEIAENLHRADLTKEERDRQIRRYAELLEVVPAVLPQSAAKLSVRGRAGEGRPVGIARKVAEQTGLSVDTVRRAINPPAPKPVPPARDPHNDYEVVQRQVDGLMRAWNAAGPEAREQFLAKIDSPVFDSTRAA